jgi:hypothetical protein
VVVGSDGESRGCGGKTSKCPGWLWRRTPARDRKLVKSPPSWRLPCRVETIGPRRRRRAGHVFMCLYVQREVHDLCLDVSRYI